jgi:hypothetical protein
MAGRIQIIKQTLSVENAAGSRNGNEDSQTRLSFKS